MTQPYIRDGNLRGTKRGMTHSLEISSGLHVFLDDLKEFIINDSPKKKKCLKRQTGVKVLSQSRKEYL